jgi:acetoacetyl-CoA synthetase
VENSGIFWREVWQYARLLGSLGGRDHNGADDLWDRRFFPDGKLNFAENLLNASGAKDTDPAICGLDEASGCTTLDRRELAQRVYQMARRLKALGITPGDRVAAVMPNSIEAIVGFLATSAIGGVWTCCSPEFGDDAIVDRFAQTTPKLLIHATASWYNGKRFDHRARIGKLESRLPSLIATLIVENDAGVQVGKAYDRTWRIEDRHTEDRRTGRVTVWYTDVLDSESREPIEFERFEFNHPLYILYSSGTTGAPKCIVHGAGGTLLQHVKEQQLHSDVHPGDRLFYFTTTGWMMWNWLVSGIASGATIYLFDGSPVYPDHGILWRIAQEHRITHFGASARYYAALEKQPFEPCKQVKTDSIRVLMSTGSPLLPEQFGWLYRNVHSDIHLASISGGTDIVSCFVLGNPTIPVVAGEIQSKGLGMDVRVVDPQGQTLRGQAGELVCANSVPSMPLGFWNDPLNDRYRNTYWNRYPGVWWHGDWAMENDTGGMIIYGRSDSTLNPGGVRIGTAEIYRQLEAFPEILESVATARKEDGDEKIVLFVKLRPGIELDDNWVARVKQHLKLHCSPRHVPQWVVAARDLPKTMNGKLSEIAVRNAICGMNIGNVGALANPECLGFFQSWKP